MIKEQMTQKKTTKGQNAKRKNKMTQNTGVPFL